MAKKLEIALIKNKNTNLYRGRGMYPKETKTITKDCIFTKRGAVWQYTYRKLDPNIYCIEIYDLLKCTPTILYE